MTHSLTTLLAHRLASHGLIAPHFTKPADVVRHMGAIQAQDIPQAMRAIGSRLSPKSKPTKQTITDALAAGEIVRTWPMRGTLHYLMPEDVHRMLDLCAAKTLTGFAKRREFLGITDAHAERALDIMRDVLRGGKALTRTALGESLAAGGIPMQTQWVYHLACYAATKKLICFGPPTDKEETFVLLDERVPHPPHYTHEEQLAKLARMYIRGHGPATVDDMARRCGLGKTVCTKAIELVADELQTMTHSDKTYYYITPSAATSAKTSRTHQHDPLVLAGFDEYFLGYKDRSIVADMEHHGKLFTVNGIFFPLLLRDGRIVGSWKRTWKKAHMEAVVSCLPGEVADLAVREKPLHDYAAFWGVRECQVCAA